jgi:hypothetical protein
MIFLRAPGDSVALFASTDAALDQDEQLLGRGT